MKKSTTIATIALLGTIATLAATNLKLKSEYNNGNVRDPYTKTKLAHFSYIKTVFDSTSRNGEEFRITVSKGAEPTIGTYYRERAKLLFNVSNDTLYVRNDPFDKDHYSLYDAAVITMPELKGIFVTKGSYQIKQDNAESLTVVAKEGAAVNLQLKKLNQLTITGFDKTAFTLSAKDTINQANIQLNERSSLTANDLIIKQKTLTLGDSASVKLIGRSMKDFGLQ